MIDADGSTDPREMDSFVEALEDGADFVKGSRHTKVAVRPISPGCALPGTRLFVFAANALYGSRFTDLCYGSARSGAAMSRTSVSRPTVSRSRPSWFSAR